MAHASCCVVPPALSPAFYRWVSYLGGHRGRKQDEGTVYRWSRRSCACVALDTLHAFDCQSGAASEGNSSKWIHQTFRNQRLFEWQEGYGAFSIAVWHRRHNKLY